MLGKESGNNNEEILKKIVQVVSVSRNPKWLDSDYVAFVNDPLAFSPLLCCQPCHCWWSSQEYWFHHVEGFVQDVEDEDVSMSFGSSL